MKSFARSFETGEQSKSLSSLPSSLKWQPKLRWKDVSVHSLN